MCAEYVIDDQALFDAALARLEGKEPARRPDGPRGYIYEVKHQMNGDFTAVDVTVRLPFTGENSRTMRSMMEGVAMVEIVGVSR